MEIINLGNRIANNYIFRIDNGYVLVDTGYENGYKAFWKALKRKNIDIKDILYVFLTHAHDDHAGFLNELLHHSQAKVILHKNAIVGLRRRQGQAFVSTY